MFKKLSLAGAVFAMGAASLIPATPAMAQSRYDRQYSQDRYGNGYGNNYRGNRGDRYDRGYRNYRGQNYNYRGRQRCDNGDGGTIVGAIAGGLIGNSVAGRGDRTLGAILGAGAGALAGRAIDRSDNPRYCR
jgi:hypothetical protein